MLKCEFHCHAKEDPAEFDKINYSYRDVFSLAKKKGYNFVALTFHNKLFFNSDVKYFAKKYGLITCPAVEITLKGKHVLLYGISQDEFKKIKEFEDLKEHLCVAPHPFYTFKNCLNEEAEKHKDVFDAVEISSVHAPLLNHWNNKARIFAKKNKLPIIATSDMHHLWQMNKSYTYVDTSSDDIDDIFLAIKKGRSKIFQTKGSYFDVGRFVLSDFKQEFFRKFSGHDSSFD